MKKNYLAILCCSLFMGCFILTYGEDIQNVISSITSSDDSEALKIDFSSLHLGCSSKTALTIMAKSKNCSYISSYTKSDKKDEVIYCFNGNNILELSTSTEKITTDLYSWKNFIYRISLIIEVAKDTKVKGLFTKLKNRLTEKFGPPTNYDDKLYYWKDGAKVCLSLLLHDDGRKFLVVDAYNEKMLDYINKVHPVSKETIKL